MARYRVLQSGNDPLSHTRHSVLTAETDVPLQVAHNRLGGMMWLVLHAPVG